MTARLFALAALLGLAASAAPVAAQQRIVGIDLDRCFTEYHKTKAADAEIKKQAEAFKEDRRALVDAYRKLEDEFTRMRDDAANKALSDDARLAKRTVADAKFGELREQEGRIRRFDEQHQKQLDDQSKLVRKKLVGEILEIVNGIAKQAGYSMVIDISGDSLNGVRTVLYIDPKDDITQAIIARLNLAQPAAAPARK